MDKQRQWRQFLSDAGAAGLVSMAAALASLAISVYEHLSGNSLGAYWFLFASAVLWGWGAYCVWKKKDDQLKQAIENRLYPDIKLSVTDIIIESRGEVYFDCFLFVYAHNLTPGVVTRITEFKCEIEIDGAFCSSSFPQDDVGHFCRVLFDSTPNATHSTVVVSQYDLHPGDLRDILQRGSDKKGWIHFCIDVPLEILFPGLTEYRQRHLEMLTARKHLTPQDIKRLRLSVKDNFDKWHSTEQPYQWTENDGVRAKQRL